jgi:hypothetical protein
MHSNGAAKRCASIKYNFNLLWEAHMRLKNQYTMGIRSNKLQILWLFQICAGDRQSERQR